MLLLGPGSLNDGHGEASNVHFGVVVARNHR